jgi:hypothetical protein
MRAITSAIIVFGLASMTACTSQAPTDTTQSAAPKAATPAQSTAALPITLPVSINAVMVALVDHASEPLWVAAYEPPSTPDRWLEAEYEAYQMAIAGKLVQLAGTGPNDADWVARPEWRAMANELSAAGMDALRAAQAKDVMAVGTAGDRLVAACDSCHTKFKPSLTSMGIYKSPSYPPKNK